MANLNLSFFSASLAKNAKVMVVLPTVSADDHLFNENHPQYYRPGARYQTLYLLHGSYGDCLDWELLANIYRYANENCLAVVMPSGENSSYVNMVHGERYLTYITEELPRFCETLFPLSAKRENTFIAGLSMGGYGAFRAALEHPEQYACAASLSGALDKAAASRDRNEAHARKMPQNYQKAVMGDDLSMKDTENDLRVVLKKRVDEGADLPKLYHTIGEDDFLRPAGEAYLAYAKELGVDIEYHNYPGVHDWNYWDAHIQDVLRWLPLKHDMVD
jgi:S-formylglutathione hydrolase FrmB